jgi:hypothetical protein
MNMLLNDSTDADVTGNSGQSGIDRSIGYLVGGVAVLLFFLLTVLGMGRVQSISDNTVGTNRNTSEPKSADINDSTVIESPRTE